MADAICGVSQPAQPQVPKGWGKIPDRIPFSDDSEYRLGWNGCIDAMLTAASITTTNGQVCSVSTDDKKSQDDTAAQEGK